MSKRGINGTLETSSERASSQYFECVKFELPNQTYRISNAPFDIPIGSDTYQGVGVLMAFDEVEDNATLEIQKMNITVSGILEFENADLAPIEDFLQLDYTHAPVTISRAYVEDEGIVGNFVLFKGYISSASFLLNTQESATVSIEVQNHLGDFEREAGRYTNESSQGRYYPGDRGLQYAGEVQKEIKWKV